MATFRRDKLQRLVEAGRVVKIASYHYDDMMGESRSHVELPVRMMPLANPVSGIRPTQEGICYLYPSDFISKSGYCHQNDNGTICLSVHSNSSYDLRILPELR